MSKFYALKEFKELDREWKERLAKEGFNDAEDCHGRLTTQDRRTIAFQNRLQIQEFFLTLDSYLNNPNTTDVTERDRLILELHSQGVHVKGITGISARINWSAKTVYRVIWKYKRLLLKRSIS